MTRPPPSPAEGRSAGCASRFTTMRPLTARTLCEWVWVGTSTVANVRGRAGSLTSTMEVPCGAFMCAMYATVPSTETCPPPGQSSQATCFSPWVLGAIAVTMCWRSVTDAGPLAKSVTHLTAPARRDTVSATRKGAAHGPFRRPVRATHRLRPTRRENPGAGPGRGERRALRPRARAGAAARVDRPDRAHPRAVHPRAVPSAPRRRRGALRQQRPLPAQLARHARSGSAHAARAGLPAGGPDHLVPAHRPRPVEPAPRQDARPLRAPLRAEIRGQAAAAPSALAGSGAARHRGHVAREAQRLAYSRAARRGDQRVSGFSRAVGGSGPRAGQAQRAAGPARLRRPHRRAGPRLPRALLHYRPQVLSRAGHGRARAAGGLGERPLRALRGRARHRGRPPLVLELRDGLPGRAEPHGQSGPRAARQRRSAQPGG